MTTPNETLLSVSEAARRLDARPKDVTDFFYKRLLRDDLCPIVAGRRAIPESYLGMIASALRQANKPTSYFDKTKGASVQ